VPTKRRNGDDGGSQVIERNRGRLTVLHKKLHICKFKCILMREDLFVYPPYKSDFAPGFPEALYPEKLVQTMIPSLFQL
jgi:hypothetical protein